MMFLPEDGGDAVDAGEGLAGGGSGVGAGTDERPGAGTLNGGGVGAGGFTGAVRSGRFRAGGTVAFWAAKNSGVRTNEAEQSRANLQNNFMGGGSGCLLRNDWGIERRANHPAARWHEGSALRIRRLRHKRCGGGRVYCIECA